MTVVYRLNLVFLESMPGAARGWRGRAMKRLVAAAFMLAMPLGW